MSGWWDKIKAWFRKIDRASRENMAEMYERDLMELENIFAVLNFGVIVGLPMPPVHISAELLPLMEEELIIMFNRLDTAANPLGELFSVFDID